LQRCSASAAGTVCRGFQAAADKADKEALRRHYDKENSDAAAERTTEREAAAQSRKRARPNDPADDPHGQAGQLADKSCASENMAACDEKKRRALEKLEALEAAGRLAEQNREESGKRAKEQLKERLARGALAEKTREENAQRKEKVCVAFCLQCTGTFLALAALVPVCVLVPLCSAALRLHRQQLAARFSGCSREGREGGCSASAAGTDCRAEAAAEGHAEKAGSGSAAYEADPLDGLQAKYEKP
jgi:hypothetical protein